MSIIKKWNSISLILRILIGLVVGAVLGLLLPKLTGIGILGTLFVGALKAIAPVLVFVLVSASIAKRLWPTPITSASCSGRSSWAWL